MKLWSSVLLISYLIFFSVVENVLAKYSGGSGEPNDPYQIATAQDLIDLGNEPNDYDKYFIQDANIDLSGYIFDGALIAWDTDSNDYDFQGTPFSGTFNGNGYIIYNLSIQGSYYLGMFGMVNRSAILSNIALDNVDVNGIGDYVGGLVGYNYGSITSSYSIGIVNGDEHVGGLVGYNRRSITTSYSTGTVSGDLAVGGLVGRNSGSITLSYCIGTASGKKSVGGLVGMNFSTISSSYSTDTVSGDWYVGGLVGENVSGDITSSYSTGTVIGDGSIGGLVGSYSGSITSSFWDTQTSGLTTSYGGIGLKTTQMQDVNNYLNAGWDFIGEQNNGTCNFWYIQEGGYPQLAVFSDFVPFEPQGSGTTDDPYLIYDANDLGTVWYRPEAYYQLAEDIDLSDILWNTSVVPFFDGRFDGNSYIIKSLNVKGAGFLGLFGVLGYTTEISYMNLESVDVNSTGDYVGGLVGKNYGSITSSRSTGIVNGDEHVGGLVGYNYGSITSSYSTGIVNGDEHVGGLVGHNRRNITTSYSTGTVSGVQFVGGLVGCNDRHGNSITSSYSTGTVSGKNSVGGLVGCNDCGFITSSYSTGTVSGEYAIGGLVGFNYNGGIMSSYSTGTVSGDWCVGGLVGENYQGMIISCYSTANVNGEEYIGGLVGSISGYNYSIIISSFWDIETSGQSESADGTGKITVEMQDINTFLNAGWDFIGETDNGTEDIWWIDNGLDYPHLWWELETNN